MLTDSREKLIQIREAEVKKQEFNSARKTKAQDTVEVSVESPSRSQRTYEKIHDVLEHNTIISRMAADPSDVEGRKTRRTRIINEPSQEKDELALGIVNTISSAPKRASTRQEKSNIRKQVEQ